MSGYTERNALGKIKVFDLNLLTVFEMVYTHSSVSLAASSMGMTPSAVSQSLQKLRSHFNDPLFIREGKGISATTVATNLHEQLTQSMEQLGRVVSVSSENDLKKKFVVYSPPFMGMALLPAVLQGLHNDGVDYEIVHHSGYTESVKTEELLSFRKADIIFSTSPYTSFSTVCVPCAETELLFVCRKDHPRLNGVLTRELAAQEKFTAFNVDDPEIVAGKIAINDALGSRNTVFSSNSMLTIMSVVENTDTVGGIPIGLMQRFAGNFNVQVLKTDFAMPRVTFYMIYNRSSTHNPVFSAMLERLKKEIPESLKSEVKEEG
ncbi:LysR substrate-binding domain-containing protein [Hafnia alvei]|uniref:DNA-binding transcriptional regulator, LysR family n=1 Tax=Hafnia alvei TaxID=569 RepID=A0A1C6Z0T1_HAFAL|nr:LysR substrate-binding domain-containing protein [Hafnia alvei]NLS53038.1 LysR family transcriptional regulator [Hafnia alvei]SCM52621.1 DNA-binding transcriptional regulator, LysR family [Hafnia alvei]